jgi:hypothetical protein
MTSTALKDKKVPHIPQALLKRHPSMTKEQFSAHWYNSHAPKVIPYFLSAGVDYYAQIHNPVLIPGASPAEDLDISDWDGAAELKFAEVTPEGPEGGKKYFQEVILVDERRFLISEALDHVKRVDPGTVKGDRKVIIEGGNVVCELDYGSDAKIWTSYANAKEIR